MRNPFPIFILFVLLIGLLSDCKDRNASFSPGSGDSRIVGTWRLYERRFPKDSVIFYYTTTSVLQDSVYVLDTVRTSRDTTFYTVQQYKSNPEQSLTFATDGKLSANGTEMTYYSPFKYFNVDTTYPDSLFISLYIYTNGANIATQQALEFRDDTLVFKPNCDEPPCYSKLLRIR